MPEPAYVLSKWVQSLRLDDESWIVAHGPRLQRMVLAEPLHQVLMLFGDEPLTLAELVDGVELEGIATPAETLTAMLRAFVEKGFLVEAGGDEDERVRGEVRARLVSAVPYDRYQMPHRLDVADFEVAPELAGGLRHLDVLFLGGCLIQLAEEPLRKMAPSRGLTVAVRSGWLGDTHLLSEGNVDLVVVQPSVHRLLEPLWGGAAFFASDEERRRALEALKAELARTLAPFDRFAGYVLLQGMSSLQMAPHGRADFRLPTGHHRVVYELNELLRAHAAARPNMMYVDEERLAANHGKATLFDDMITVAAHHGPIDATLPRLLAREYLDCWTILTGDRRIKLVVTDLDNTLWAGVVGEGAVAPNPRPHPFPAIHETLRTLKQRGVLLASCSKNNRDDTLAFWRGIEAEPGVLAVDDFALHSIDWDPKGARIARIAEALGVAPSAILFIDDNPVERAEVQAALPAVRVRGEELGRLRAELLGDPCLQPNLVSDEARERTTTTRAMLARKEAEAQAGDAASFLRSLDVRLNITRLRTPLHLARIVELSQRTNQFNTTLVRYDASALERLVADEGAALFALAVQDRFAPYGLVGICAVAGERIENMAISCRTLGLKVEQPFLAAVLRETGLWSRRAVGRIIEGERNQPCRRLFSDASFVAVGDGLFAREPTAAPPSIDASVYAVSVCGEAELLRFA
ncbi:MAG TPA: HAD-IIIC family phosphatase [Polyangia bacterium]